MHPIPYRARATQTRCLKLSRVDFERLFGSLHEVLAQHMRIRILKSVPLLARMGDETLTKLSQTFSNCSHSMNGPIGPTGSSSCSPLEIMYSMQKSKQ